MSEKGANIDLLFRNGLKDYEVLPPSGVWDGISASGRVKKRPLIFFRIAAAVTALVTIGLLTYTYTRNVTEESGKGLTAFNMIVQAPIKLDRDNQQYIAPLVSSPDLRQVLNETEYIDPVVQDIRVDSSPGGVSHFMSNKNLSISNNEIKRDLSLTPSSQPEEVKSVSLYYSDFQYSPEVIETKPVARWSIAAMASPTYYSRFNTTDDVLSSQLMSSEQPLVSYSGGVAFSYKLSKRLSVQSGLYYSSLGQKLEGINSFGGFRQYDNTKGDNNFTVLTSSGTVSASNPDVFLNAEANNRFLLLLQLMFLIRRKLVFNT